MNEWIIVAVVGVVLLFSAKKLPDMARGLGQSMRIFKAETRGMREDEQAGAQGSAGSAGSAGSPAPGEVAPGRVAGPVEPGTNGAATQAGTQAGAGSADGTPRAGS